MPGQHTEHAFETAIEHHLTTTCGYAKGDREGFDADRGIFPGEVLAFIKATQPQEWDYLGERDGVRYFSEDDSIRTVHGFF